jgi:hypothetical protein
MAASSSNIVPEKDAKCKHYRINRFQECQTQSPICVTSLIGYMSQMTCRSRWNLRRAPCREPRRSGVAMRLSLKRHAKETSPTWCEIMVRISRKAFASVMWSKGREMNRDVPRHDTKYAEAFVTSVRRDPCMLQILASAVYRSNIGPQCQYSLCFLDGLQFSITRMFSFGALHRSSSMHCLCYELCPSQA